MGNNIGDGNLWCVKSSTTVEFDLGNGIFTSSVIALEGSSIDINVTGMVLARVFRRRDGDTGEGLAGCESRCEGIYLVR